MDAVAHVRRGGLVCALAFCIGLAKGNNPSSYYYMKFFSLFIINKIPRTWHRCALRAISRLAILNKVNVGFLNPVSHTSIHILLRAFWVAQPKHYTRIFWGRAVALAPLPPAAIESPPA